jgi:hypothetical protein
MDQNVLRQRLQEIMDSLSAVKPAGAARQYQPCPPLGKSPDEMLDNLRLQMKYMLFDLDATRRENRYLRQMIERRPNLGDNRPDEY